MNYRQLFLKHIAQTSDAPIAIEMQRAHGIYMFDVHGKEYIDGISGFSVANIGHSHPKVVSAVQQQASEYMHLIVYGEFIQQPQVAYAKLLTDYLPATLNCVYFTNSGTEATEGAMKLAKRITGRTKIQAFHNAYHGSTQGSLSIMGSEYWRNAYRPLLPEVYHLEYGSDAALEAIDANTACVVVEMVQAEAGIVRPANEWLQALRDKCTANGVMLIADEIQSGFGRTGTLWAFEQTGIVPDILLLGKALGGGMPLGAFIAAREFMQLLTHDPVLGHITTFGGHPVSCAAGKAAFEVLLDRNFTKTVKEKESFLKMHLQHPAIKTIRSAGLWMAVEFDSFETNYKVIHQCIQHGLITDWFLFRSQAMRIAPPLCIQKNELKKIAGIVLQSIIDTGVE
ncbi:MAG: aminotransferase class III-fold pyridoxal phosphate-dependent enzyme [Hydrotalea flava]|uniref:aspartate aminotransferase family protein n=1 Tax=unclassified Hydrotalea TaxID=2643788 RepID=UPI0009425AA9|nr:MULTISPECIES: aspartate aminotransferase family protein [unclassified Hydrotalea]NIM34779.1 aminotransferase class III-fold pyridoxal phosphate-dependent enzyme [Hydrotalea flava]NIM37615.1 aminotransferase class III-fold pyridoxal phosphate-dependent enzyme [Hydrotalea flava]NIN02775.1 aminotransferase class III-fold pyridoxal phosphate-dependent enzyme [Hydrotalea flava]NIN14460.1 aminotransferase class III-fold pyridoxal phosphate-dependent enzyme [Hydrotalea flava]NIO93541.1 aminotransf